MLPIAIEMSNPLSSPVKLLVSFSCGGSVFHRLIKLVKLIKKSISFHLFKICHPAISMWVCGNIVPCVAESHLRDMKLCMLLLEFFQSFPLIVPFGAAGVSPYGTGEGRGCASLNMQIS